MDTNIYLYDRKSKKLVSPEPQDTIPVIKGTEADSLFAVVISCPDAVIGVRQLKGNVGSPDLSDGVESRIRILPLNADSPVIAFAEKLGFTKKNGGHLSVVTSAAATTVRALSAFIEVV